MIKLLNGRVAFSLFLTLVLLYLLFATLGLNYESKIVPLIVVTPSFVGALVQFVIEVRRALRGEKVSEGEGIDQAIAQAAESRARAILISDQGIEPATAVRLVPAGAAAGAGQAPVAATAAAPKEEKKKKLAPHELFRGELVAAGWIAGFVVLIALFGFRFGFPAFVFLFSKIQGKESWKFSIAFALIFWGIVYGLFVVVMKEILYPGVIPDALGW